ncbi:MAG: DUF4160 domain-containing protein [Kiritimatiellae bacterium]|jgi:hypothetical protein|nr:DUF4160 domain-containing protein [Kiritimatiellia bacterium]
MPVISRFFGIIIYMLWRDHAPPHFHAKYQNSEVSIENSTGKVTGKMSKRALKMLEEWRKKHVNDLLNDWKLAESKKQLMNIEPLE